MTLSGTRSVLRSSGSFVLAPIVYKSAILAPINLPVNENPEISLLFSILRQTLGQSHTEIVDKLCASGFVINYPTQGTTVFELRADGLLTKRERGGSDGVAESEACTATELREGDGVFVSGGVARRSVAMNDSLAAMQIRVMRQALEMTEAWPCVASDEI